MTPKQAAYIKSLADTVRSRLSPREWDALWERLPDSVCRWWCDTTSAHEVQVAHGDVQLTLDILKSPGMASPSILQRMSASPQARLEDLFQKPAVFAPYTGVVQTSYLVRSHEGDGKECFLWVLIDEDREAIRQLPVS